MDTVSDITRENPLTLREQILDISRQNRIGPLTPWFSQALDRAIANGDFLPGEKLKNVSATLTEQLVAYRVETGVSTVVLGMSGGIDSALTAALFKKAGWTVIGVTMPIHQVPEETDRGVSTIEALGLDEHVHVDLSDAFETLMPHLNDARLLETDSTKAEKIRRGNVRARLRMITLYNLAAARGGLVASTDNLSELTAGFWTLHGDVGDVSPIQSLNKSWEVPFLARLNNVPENTVTATPTDGLGIDAGDEAQLGCSYLEWDLITGALAQHAKRGMNTASLAKALGIEDAETFGKLNAVVRRMGGSWFKRKNPVNLPHPFADRYGQVDAIDSALFVPPSFS